ncbi:MAG: reverse transcriptase-like protein [Candidatus Saccharibacteria bacterium]|nr:reverse transcriptase-like protein [Candidatus Saccharibacteria bacterium]
MKQRIRVVGIVSRGDDILLLKRAQGRVEAEPVWELPTGKIAFGEQPEEAMTRTMEEMTGISISDLKLKDVITFVALAGASRLYNLYIVFEISIPIDAKVMLGDRYLQYKFLRQGSDVISGMRLEDATLSVLSIELGSNAPRIETRNVANGATIYIDGASKGNPGPSGIGYYIIDESGHEVKRGGEFIGFATSRVAEYYALKEGIEQALELGMRSVRFVSDNLMLVNQMNGIYKVKNQDLMPVYNDVQRLIREFEAVAFVHVKRGFNQQADEQANLAIVRHFEKEEDNVI